MTVPHANQTHAPGSEVTAQEWWQLIVCAAFVGCASIFVFTVICQHWRGTTLGLKAEKNDPLVRNTANLFQEARTVSLQPTLIDPLLAGTHSTMVSAPKSHEVPSAEPAV